VNKVYLCGIGGIGMANLAVLLKEAGYSVSGSDGTIYEPAASVLRRADIETRTPYAADNIPHDGMAIIVGNAQSRNHVEIERILELDLPLWSFPDFLNRHIMSGRHRMVVAGTHGKSSTTACLAHVLRAAGVHCGYFVGALPIGEVSGAAVGDLDAPFVLEGDEYDTAFFDKRSKFLHYYPRTLLLGTVEYDHADIFSSKEDMILAFRRLMMLLPRNGTLIYNSDCEETRRLADLAACRKVTVGKSAASNWQLMATSTCLSFRAPDAKQYDCPFDLPGEHQRWNALMALAAAESYAPNLETYMHGLSAFRSLRRRLEKTYESRRLVVYDDFAHHPTAIAATLAALREKYPDHHLIAVVEPRSNTMVRKIFQDELPRALGIADNVIIGNIHRQERIPLSDRLDVEYVMSELVKAGTTCEQIPHGNIASRIISFIPASRATVVVFMSNGGFDGVPQQFVTEMQSNNIA
jgi:UDP-N-acetylmuramate: L-alanyl-gamma-D-glutamyl-meso-diaminopimelate ligase